MNIAFIPVRGGSKSIPLKNIKLLCGKPLVYWTIKAACESHFIDRVFVSTDSDKIKEAVLTIKETESFMSEKVEIVNRSRESATDTASTEFVMLEFAKEHDFDNIVLVQATSPLLQGSDIDRGFEEFNKKDTDSVLSVVPQKRFNWAENESGFANPTNYDIFHRPRRQEFNGYFVENGAFYITSRERLLETGNRLSGNIKLCLMSEDSYFEIDEVEDWVVSESLLSRRINFMNAINQKNNTIGNLPIVNNLEAIFYDCDGVLTNNMVDTDENGIESLCFNRSDGLAISEFRKFKIHQAIISTETNPVVARRAEKLQIPVIHKLDTKSLDKGSVLKSYAAKNAIELSHSIFIGNDINDLSALELVGYPCAPIDAEEEVIAFIKDSIEKSGRGWISTHRGGCGVVRELYRLIQSGNNSATE